MLSVVGAILVLLACMALAMQKLAKEKQKNNLMRDFQQLFRYLSEKMAYTQETLFSLLQQAKEEHFGETEAFLQILICELSDESAQTLKEAWEKSLRQYTNLFRLTPCMRKILREVGNHMGQLVLSAEIENLNRACSELESERKRGEKELVGKTKLIRSAGILFGMMLVILFL